MTRPATPRAYTAADRDAFEARYGWPAAEQVQADTKQRAPLLPHNRLDIAIGFAIGMSALASLQAVAPMLRIIAQ